MHAEVTKDAKYEPSVCLKMSKKQVSELTIGEHVSATVSGKVTGVRECYDDKELYDVDLKPFTVGSVSMSNVADKSIKKLVGDKEPKKI